MGEWDVLRGHTVMHDVFTVYGNHDLKQMAVSVYMESFVHSKD